MMNEKEKKPAIDIQIVENLRRAYNQTLEEEVPERFLSLIKQLKEKDQEEDQEDDVGRRPRFDD